MDADHLLWRQSVQFRYVHQIRPKFAAITDRDLNGRGRRKLDGIEVRHAFANSAFQFGMAGQARVELNQERRIGGVQIPKTRWRRILQHAQQLHHAVVRFKRNAVAESD
jgi:hypothetical protein